jgi:hypothetical protein
VAGLTLAKLTPNADTTFGNTRIKFRDITFDDSYPTGGESLTAANFGLKHLDAVIPHGPAVDSDGSGGTNAVTVTYDHTNSKLQAFRQIDPADTGGDQVSLPEVGSTDSLANYTVRVTAIGH